MKVKIGISARHVHLSEEDFKILFPNGTLNFMKEMSQKPNFVSDKKVTLRFNDKEINNVTVVGPFRNKTQVELSKTDCHFFKINAVVASSNDLTNASKIQIINGKNMIERDSVIIQNRHIHMNEKDALEYGYHNDQIVKVKIDTIKGGILYNVHIKTGKEFVTELHLDTDDANAFLIDSSVEGEIIND